MREKLVELRWRHAPAGVRIAPEEVHVWLVRTDVADELLASSETLLSQPELERAARASAPSEHRRRVVRSASRRCILAEYLAESPEALRFHHDSFGASALDHPASLTFSATHACDTSLLAIGRDRPLGIDVEPLAAAAEIEEIADTYLPVERVRTIRRRPQDERAEEWVRLWTELEACSKVDGRGIGDLDPSTAKTLLGQPGHRVYLRPDSRHAATLVYGGSPARLSCFVLDARKLATRNRRRRRQPAECESAPATANR